MTSERVDPSISIITVFSCACCGSELGRRRRAVERLRYGARRVERKWGVCEPCADSCDLSHEDAVLRGETCPLITKVCRCTGVDGFVCINCLERDPAYEAQFQGARA